MPTAADFSLAASCLRTAIADVAIARAPIDGIDDHGVHGGTSERLVDRAIEEQERNLTGLHEALGDALEVAEYRQAVCEEFSRTHASWQTAASAWDREARMVGPNATHSRPPQPQPPATWVER